MEGRGNIKEWTGQSLLLLRVAEDRSRLSPITTEAFVRVPQGRFFVMVVSYIRIKSRFIKRVNSLRSEPVMSSKTSNYTNTTIKSLTEKTERPQTVGLDETYWTQNVNIADSITGAFLLTDNPLRPNVLQYKVLLCLPPSGQNSNGKLRPPN